VTDTRLTEGFAMRKREWIWVCLFAAQLSGLISVLNYQMILLILGLSFSIVVPALTALLAGSTVWTLLKWRQWQANR
jgi:hypothetical protein